jgi:hypothetical protein
MLLDPACNRCLRNKFYVRGACFRQEQLMIVGHLALSGVDVGLRGNGVPSPANFTALECAVHQLAFETAASKVGGNFGAIHAALRLDDCDDHLSQEQRRANAATLAPKQPMTHTASGPVGLFVWVATSGKDTNPGTEAAPVATLQRARDLIREHRKGTTSGAPARVTIGAGTYYLEQTLELSAEDSNTQWAGEHAAPSVVLSGGRPLEGLKWTAHGGGGVLVADVKLPSAGAPPAAATGGHDFGPAPAVVNQLFHKGVRQVRARWPNGDPQQASGLCFSKDQYAGEACDGWSQASGQGKDNMPGGRELATVSFGRSREPNRAVSHRCIVPTRNVWRCQASTAATRPPRDAAPSATTTAPSSTRSTSRPPATRCTTGRWTP